MKFIYIVNILLAVGASAVAGGCIAEGKILEAFIYGAAAGAAAISAMEARKEL